MFLGARVTENMGLFESFIFYIFPKVETQFSKVVALDFSRFC